MYSKTASSAKRFTGRNVIELIKGGSPYFSLLLDIIAKAEDTIHLQTYIFEADVTGLKVAEALKAAAKRGVKVFLLADGYASQRLSKELIVQFEECGVNFRFFEPLLRSRHFYFGRRLHHKLFVADSRYALVGGINIADRYNDTDGQAAWLDFALFVQGEIVKDLCVLCWKTWNGFAANMKIIPCDEILPPSDIDAAKYMDVRMRRNDWVRRKNEISVSYAEMFRHATSHVTIVCSYFLPGKFIRRLLKNASRRGVKIRVVTAGRSDIKLAKHAERWMYDWLLRNNIELYEYQPTVLHAKVAACDNEWATIGSYNVNNISAYASVELNLDVRNREFTTHLQQTMQAIIQNDCRPITREEHQHAKNMFIQFVRWCSYHFIRVVFYLLTFYYKRGA